MLFHRWFSIIITPFSSFVSAILIFLLFPATNLAQCTASFSLPSGPYCQGDSLFITDLSTPPGNLTFFYDFGDGGTSNAQHPGYAYTSSGTFNLRLTIVDTVTSCFDDTTIAITIDPAPPTPILFDGNGVPGTNPVWRHCKTPADPDSLVVDFTAASNIDSFTLDFGDGTDTSGSTWSFGDIITHVYQNLGSYSITLTVTGANGCTSIITGQVINLRNPTAGIIGPPAGQNQGCAPHLIRFINNADPNTIDPTTIFEWDMADGTTYTWDYTMFNDTLYHVYQPFTSTCNMTVTLTATNECANSVTTWSPVDIYDRDITAIAPDSVFMCWPNNEVTFTNGTALNCIVGLREYFWDFGDGNTIGWGPDPAPIDYTYNAPGTYHVMMVDSNPCGTDTAWSVVVIANPPTASIAAVPDTVCVGNPITFTNSSSGGATTFAWNFGDNTGWQTVSSMAPLQHTYYVDKTYTVQMIASFPGLGCSDTAQIEVVVLPGTVANFTPSLTDACDSAIVSFTDNSTNAVIWQWDFDNGNTDNTATPPDQNYNTTGSYTVTLYTESQNGCTSNTQQVINISPKPIAEFQPSLDQACDSANITFTNNSMSAVDWDWDFGNGQTANVQFPPAQLFDSPGTYIVRLTVTTAAGCDSTHYDTLVIVPGAQASFLATPPAACDSATVVFQNNSTNAVSYTWDFDNGNTSTLTNPPPQDYNINGTHTVELIAVSPDNCLDTAYVPVVISPSPVASFSFTQNSICDTGRAFFIDNSTFATTWQWDFGDNGSTDTSTQQHPSYFYPKNGTYIVTLTVSSAGGCSDMTTDTVIIYKNSVAAFIPSPNTGCDSALVNFTSMTSNTLTRFWDFGDAGNNDTSSLKHPSYLYTAPGTYPVSLTTTSTEGCVDQAFDTIYIYPVPVPAFTASLYAACDSATISFTDQSTGAQGWDWDFGNGNTFDSLYPPPQFYDNTGIYVVRLTVTNSDSCSRTFRDTIEIFEITTASFTVSQDLFCDSGQVQFDGSGTHNAASWAWDFDNGNTGTDTIPAPEAFRTIGDFHVSLATISPDGCTDTLFDTIQVRPSPTALFSAQNVCHDSTLSFLDSSTVYHPISAISSWNWDFGDGNTSTDSLPVHIYATADTFNVTLTVATAENCVDDYSDTVVVYAPPIAGFTIQPVADCHPLEVTLNEISVSQDNTIVNQWDWDFDGDGSSDFSGQNPGLQTFTNTSHTQDSIYSIQMAISTDKGCKDTLTLPVTVKPYPDVNLSKSTLFGCSPLSIDLFNLTLADDYAAMTFSWDFGDGTGSNDTSLTVSHTYPQQTGNDTTYYITLVGTTSFGCIDTTYDSILVLADPVANFNIFPDSGCHPLTVNFQNTSINGSSFSWDLGNGALSADHTPAAVIYTNTGSADSTYTVTLTAFSNFGCQSVPVARNVVVHPSPVAGFSAPDTIDWPPGEITILNTTAFPTSFEFLWDFGDQQSSTAADPTIFHTYEDFGFYDIVLWVTNPTDGHCQDTLTHRVFAKPPPPQAILETNTGSGCEPLEVVFTDSSRNVSHWWLDYGDGTLPYSDSASFVEQTHTYHIPGTYVATMVVNGPGGPPDTVVLDTFRVYANPIAGGVCKPDLVFLPAQEIACFENSSDFVTDWLWDFGDGTTTANPNPDHLYKERGRYDVYLLVTTAFGCRDTALIGTIVAEVKGDLFYPNAFTPNGDGVNDRFLPKGLGIDPENYLLQIFNRWGEIIYVQRSPGGGWDGTFKGTSTVVKQDVYVWKLTWKYLDGQGFQQKVGTVTLIR